MPVQLPMTAQEGFFGMVVIGGFPAFMMVVGFLTGGCVISGPASLQNGGKATIAVLGAMIVWQYWVYMYLWHHQKVHHCGISELLLSNPVTLLLTTASERPHIILYHTSMILWVTSWYRGITTNVTSDKHTAELAAVIDTDQFGEVQKRHRSEGIRRCKEIGGGSVIGFDHYCPIISNAVGRKNHKYFILALVYQLCSGYFLLRDGIPEAIRILSQREYTDYSEPQILFGVVLSIYINGVVAFLLFVQLIVIPTGISSVEFWTLFPWVEDSYQARRPSFPRISNIRKTMGSLLLIWLPIETKLEGIE
eukprot:TRINITY_DN20130_c0_g1_i1.p1 TRINITY_DN20130_c0_g1~~TRINITY_DN20130_c0_g1_i1.p1  ORF type:complete len:307 (+),score=29.00 TRINITY_DN20130_c0_g1_i1:44-964(+)